MRPNLITVPIEATTKLNLITQLTDHLDLSIHRMTSATNALNLGIVRTIALTHRLLAVSDGGT